MAKQLPIEEKLEITVALVDLVNQHWIRLKGEMFNDREFWDQTLHSLTNQDWWDLLEAMKWIRSTKPDLFNYAVNSVMEDIEKILMTKGHIPRVLDSRRYKKTEFLALMWIKDIINEIRGIELPTKFPNDEPPTRFDTLFTRN